MNRQIGGERECIRNGKQTVLGVWGGDFDNVELLDRRAFMIAEERKRGSHTSAKGCTDLRRIGTDDRQITVVHSEVVLQMGQVPHLARAFWSPVAPVEAQDEWKTVGELGELDDLGAMIRQFQIWKRFANNELWMHVEFLIMLEAGRRRPQYAGLGRLGDLAYRPPGHNLGPVGTGNTAPQALQVRNCSSA